MHCHSGSHTNYKLFKVFVGENELIELPQIKSLDEFYYELYYYDIKIMFLKPQT